MNLIVFYFYFYKYPFFFSNFLNNLTCFELFMHNQFQWFRSFPNQFQLNFIFWLKMLENVIQDYSHIIVKMELKTTKNKK